MLFLPAFNNRDSNTDSGNHEAVVWVHIHPSVNTLINVIGYVPSTYQDIFYLICGYPIILPQSGKMYLLMREYCTVNDQAMWFIIVTIVVDYFMDTILADSGI